MLLKNLAIDLTGTVDSSQDFGANVVTTGWHITPIYYLAVFHSLNRYRFQRHRTFTSYITVKREQAACSYQEIMNPTYY